MNAGRRHLLRIGGAAAVCAMGSTQGVRAAPSLKIGLTLPLTSHSAQAVVSTSAFSPELGQDYLVALRAALEAQRLPAGVDVVALDDAGLPERAADNVKRLADSGAVALSGLWTTDIARACIAPLQRAGLPTVGLRSGSPELVSANVAEFFFLKPSWEDEAAALARSLQQTGFGNFAVLVAEGPEGQRLLKAFTSTGARAVATQVVEEQADASALARQLAGTKDAHAMLLLVHGLALSTAVSELRGRDLPFLRPICTLSTALTRSLVESRDRRYAGMVAASPYPNPGTWNIPLARRFRDAMTDLDLDHATRSFSAIEGFIAGTLLGRAIAAAGGRPSREALANTLRSRTWELDGVRIAFDKNQVGSRTTQLLVKSREDGRFKG